jgi:small GTP-binding protein
VTAPVLKVILVGSSGVGKTSLIAAFIRKASDQTVTPTITPAYSCHQLTRSDGVTVCLQVWDTAGQERFHSISALFYREADVAVVCFEAGSQSGIESVPAWVKRVKNQVPDCQLVFAGTKADLLTESQLANSKIAAKGALNMFQPKGYFTTSAVSGMGIDSMFQQIADLATFAVDHPEGQHIEEIAPANSREDECC